MSEFSIYFSLGMGHILDIKGIDHILFVIALCAIYSLWDWRRVLVLVTAFTIGHSITLALSTLEVIQISPDPIEFLIPVTILITALSNILIKRKDKAHDLKLNYFYALIFGLIHGLGFSNYLKSLLGKDSRIITQLLAFNLGLELGQIIIVSIFLILGYVFLNYFKVNKRDWSLVISAAIAAKALDLMFEKIYW